MEQTTNYVLKEEHGKKRVREKGKQGDHGEHTVPTGVLLSSSHKEPLFRVYEYLPNSAGNDGFNQNNGTPNIEKTLSLSTQVRISSQI